MCTFKLRRRVFWGIVLSFMFYAVVGCQVSPIRPRTQSSPSTIAPASDTKAGPAPRLEKPVEASDKSDDSQPSRWRRKLRAKYALAGGNWATATGAVA